MQTPQEDPGSATEGPSAHEELALIEQSLVPDAVTASLAANFASGMRCDIEVGFGVYFTEQMSSFWRIIDCKAKKNQKSA